MPTVMTDNGKLRAMKTESGLEVFLEEHLTLTQGKRVGAVVNPTSVDSRMRSLVSLFQQHPRIHLSAIFGPQHGVGGETQDNMVEWDDYRDSVTGLPVYSLYSSTREPSEGMLAEVDTVVFDLQDVGARYYTFIHTMVLVMKACARFQKSFIVLDRPNPINGIDVEGPVLEAGFASFVGLYPLAIRHGMTIGELALYLNQEFAIGCDLEVVKMRGWKRDMFFPETQLPWILPSPNIPTLESAMVYPGMCLLEGTNVSEGRGTTRPFELSGAPWVDPDELVEHLSGFDVPGVSFRAVRFVPTFHKWSGQLLGGVQIHIHDRRIFRPFRTGLILVMAYRQLGNGRFEWKAPPYEYEHHRLPFDILCGTDRIRKQIEASVELPELTDSWAKSLEDFRQVRQRYLLY